MVLEVEDQITLSTRFGTSVIQLLLGDITDLSVDDKVDIIFTSAFPGDYGAGIPTTLFYSLSKNLEINVRSLAKNKDLDLRKNFSCWLSKPLSPDKPFRRLACFEVLRNQNITEQISMMFRAIMPIFNGRESSIITPPLATGCQGAPIEGMVNLMVNTACNWVKAGLPLTCLKLVLFAKDVQLARKTQYSRTIKLFKGLKETWELKEKEDNSENYDITLCYHDHDAKLVGDIQSTFLKEDENLKLHSQIFETKEDDSWQEEVFQTLANSKRIVIVLTPAFVSDKWCLEQFSMGLCCNRLKGDEVVIPFYMETVESFPSYMNLVQYKECRVRKSGETFEGKVTDACQEILKAMKNSDVVAQAQLASSVLSESSKSAPVYDVFVSYSHRTPELAHIAVETLKKKYPDLNVFLDRSELKSGNIWQQALYDAINQSHSMIAFLSEPYLKSTVCQEEYNIALGRMKAKDNFMLVPVYLPDLPALPMSFTPLSPVKISNAEEVEALIDKIMPSVEKIISGKDKRELDVKIIKNVQINRRFQDFKKHFEFDETMKTIVPLEGQSEKMADIEGTVVFAYGSDGMKLAASLSESLRQSYPKIQSNLLSFTQTEARKEIESADIIVIFVSDEFLWSQHHVEELHIALCKQRALKDRTVVYLVEVEHESQDPFYMNLLPFNTSIDDPMWKRFAKCFDTAVHNYVVTTRGMAGTYMCSSAEHLALMKMKIDIGDLLLKRGQGSSLRTNLINIERMALLNKEKEDENILLSKIPTLKSFEPYMRLKKQAASSEKDNDKAGIVAPEEEELTKAEKISPEDRAKQTFQNRPKDPADMIISEMNEFFITKSTPEELKSLQEPTSIYKKQQAVNAVSQNLSSSALVIEKTPNSAPVIDIAPETPITAPVTEGTSCSNSVTAETSCSAMVTKENQEETQDKHEDENDDTVEENTGHIQRAKEQILLEQYLREQERETSAHSSKKTSKSCTVL